MRGVAVYAGLVAATLAVFLLVPQIDLLRQRPVLCRAGGFVLADWRPVVLVFRSVPWLAWGIFMVVAGASIWLFLSAGRCGASTARRCCLWPLRPPSVRPARQYRAEGSLGPGAPDAGRRVRRTASFHPGAAAGGEMRAQLLLRLRSRGARPFRSSPSPFCCRGGPPRRRGIARGTGLWRHRRPRPYRPGRPFPVGCRLCRPARFRDHGGAALVDRRAGRARCTAAAAPLRAYRPFGCVLAWGFARRNWTSPAFRIGTAVAATALLIVISMMLSTGRSRCSCTRGTPICVLCSK